MNPLRSILRLLVAAGLVLGLALPAAARAPERSRVIVLAEAETETDGDPKTASESGPRAQASAKPPVVYRPPRRGSARTRIGGGTRSVSKTPHIQVLAPHHVGLTTRAQPVLAWFLERETDLRIDFTLTRPDAIDPVIEQTLPAPSRAGVQLISLADYDVELEPGAVYEWSIAVVVDPEERDRDVFRGGAIERQAETEPLAADAGRMAPHRAFALHGIWYDAIADLSRSIEGDDSPVLAIERAELLEQVDLPEVAKFERDRLAAR